MSLNAAIQQARQIVKTLQDEQPESLPLQALNKELATIENEVRRLTLKTDSQSAVPALKADEKSGCYLSDDGTTFYCPRCYEKENKLSATQRINSRLRVCSHCRTSIKAR